MSTPNVLRLAGGARWGAVLACLVVACSGPAPADQAIDEDAPGADATYANGGRQSKRVSGCFVLGPTPSTITQAELDNIRDRINEWTQGDTGLRFTWASNLSTMQTMTFGSDSYLTSCTRDATTGRFSQRFRVYVDHRAIPAWSSVQLPRDLNIPGCTAAEGIGSQAEDGNGNPIQDPVTKLWAVESGYLWSMFPNDMANNPTCLYTLHLFPGQARNNYIHESGHGIGLSHEQTRADATCSPDGVAGIPITVYDRNSPMHYVLVCPDGTQTPGNWGADGLTAYDRLTTEIMYPMSLGARMDGQLVGWSGGNVLWAAPSWQRRGAFFSDVSGQAVLGNAVWTLDGATLSTSPQPSAAELARIGIGRHQLKLSFRNIWGDVFSSTTVVEVLPSKAAYDARAAATAMPFL